MQTENFNLPVAILDWDELIHDYSFEYLVYTSYYPALSLK